MTERQRAFADHYLATGNAAEAARRAGYSPHCANRTGHRMLTNDDVRAYIGERQRQIDSERIASVQEIMETMTSILRGETAEAAVSDRLRAANSLLRRLEAVPPDEMPMIIDDVGDTD